VHVEQNESSFLPNNIIMEMEGGTLLVDFSNSIYLYIINNYNHRRLSQFPIIITTTSYNFYYSFSSSNNATL
jgi:hypothetical protein